MYLTKNTIPFSTVQIADKLNLSNIKNFISPYSYDGNFFLDLNRRQPIQAAWLNNEFSAWMMMLYALRDHRSDFFNLIKGQMIDEIDFEHKKRTFNEFMQKMEEQMEEYDKTKMSLKELLNLASIWFLLTRAANTEKPFKSIGKQTNLCCGEDIVYVKNISQEFDQLSRIFRKSKLADLPPKDFINRALLIEDSPYTNENSLWAFIPSLEDEDTSIHIINNTVPDLLKTNTAVVFSYPKTKYGYLSTFFGIDIQKGQVENEQTGLKLIATTYGHYIFSNIGK